MTKKVSAPRCKHPNARLVKLSGEHVQAECPDCDLLWHGLPYTWYSRHACNRPHSPPKWVQRLITLQLASAESLAQTQPAPEMRQ